MRPPKGRHQYRVWLQARQGAPKSSALVIKPTTPITSGRKVVIGNVRVGTGRKTGLPVYAGPQGVVYLQRSGKLPKTWKPDSGWPQAWQAFIRDGRISPAALSSYIRSRAYMAPSGRVQRQGRSI